MYKTQNFEADTSFQKPHVVILGAGASRAAMPNGDKNGRQVPLMADLVEVIELEGFLRDNDIPWEDNENFEDIFSRLFADPQYQHVTNTLETEVRSYFSSLELPGCPTLYDHLILSLRPKDVIAIFNWGPFLLKSCERIRNQITTKTPKLFFLHGSVALGVNTISRTKGPIDLPGNCPTKLLYPISSKNYKEKEFIKCEWDALKYYLEQAHLLTIFGYSAPKTDAEAILLLQQAWGNSSDRDIEQIEIIDVKDENVLKNTWEPLIHSHHRDFHKDFYKSMIARFPRRSCEAQFQQDMMCQRLEAHDNFPKELNFSTLKRWYEPLISEEG